MTANIFEAICTRCDKMVAPGEGFVSGKIGTTWRVTHNACVPKADIGKYRKLEYDL